MGRLIAAIRRTENERMQAACTRRGYYLVKNETRHFISEKIDEAALNRVCNRVLSEKSGWNYWIDYSHGLDVHGRVAWSNVDHTDAFI